MTDFTQAIQEIAELANLGQEAQQMEIGERNSFAFIVPDDHDLVLAHAPDPLRRKGSTTVLDLPSFLSAFAKHAGPAAEIHANFEASCITAILNAADGGDAVSRGDHRLHLKLRPSKEIDRWKAANGKLLPQVEFAEFIEDYGPDIVEPSSGEMLSIASTLVAKRNLDFESGVTLHNGQRVFQYRETLGATSGSRGEIEIPERFAIGIPIYDGGQPYKIWCRFRYRIGESGLRLGFKIDQLDRVENDAFNQLTTQIAAALTPPQLLLVGPAPAEQTVNEDITFRTPRG